MLIQDGIPTSEDLSKVLPPQNRLETGPVAMAECFQKIPCNPCAKACPKKAIHVEPDINQTPQIDFDQCIGCGICQKNCEFGAVTVTNNLASIDPEKCTNCGKCAEKCPVKVIS